MGWRQPSTRALRLLPTGGLLVADWQEIHRLDGAGNVVQTYDVTGADCWYGLTLDPDGTSFWSVNRCTYKIYRFDIATGAQIAMFPVGSLPGPSAVRSGGLRRLGGRVHPARDRNHRHAVRRQQS